MSNDMNEYLDEVDLNRLEKKTRTRFVVTRVFWQEKSTTATATVPLFTHLPLPAATTTTTTTTTTTKNNPKRTKKEQGSE